MLNTRHQTYLSGIKERVEVPKDANILTEDMMWKTHGPLIWKANKFEGKPFFYPVYKYQDYYSYSLLALIIKKEQLALSDTAYEKAKRKNFEALSHDDMIDREIVRVGGPAHSSNQINDPAEYAAAIVEALKLDVEMAETANPQYTNVIMCGGKDSLNLLLLPWKNPVIAISADPNYPLVCDFVKKNGLDIAVRRLEDKVDDQFLESEALELCARFNAVHWRWGQHIAQIAQEFDHKIVIWKGQIGDLYMSTRWKTYMYGKGSMVRFLCKVYNKLSPVLPTGINSFTASLILPDVERRLWEFGANAQGAHLAYIRALADCLVLSSYHGPHMSALLRTVDLGKAVQKDIREEIGALLLGRDVIYPEKNPTPMISHKRSGLHDPDKFISMLEQNDIKII